MIRNIYTQPNSLTVSILYYTQGLWYNKWKTKCQFLKTSVTQSWCSVCSGLPLSSNSMMDFMLLILLYSYFKHFKHLKHFKLHQGMALEISNAAHLSLTGQSGLTALRWKQPLSANQPLNLSTLPRTMCQHTRLCCCATPLPLKWHHMDVCSPLHARCQVY